MDKFKYYNPVNIVFGRGEINNINSFLDGRNAVLLTSNGFIKRGVVKRILDRTNNIVQIIDNVPSNPTFSDLRRIYDTVSKEKIDVIVALGGGSVIDCAKVLSVKGEFESFDYLQKLIKSGEQKKYRLNPIIAIPTTSGTSSELTPWATVWDKENMKKYSLHLPNLWCETAIYDCELTLTLPRDVTIYSTLDALSHGFESIWNKNYNQISATHALFAIDEIVESLPKIVNNLSDLHLRERLMYASLKAGLAFSNTQTSIAHAISYYFTLRRNIPHGIACSITIPTILTVFEQTEHYKYVHRRIPSINKMEQFFFELGVSTRLSDYGITITDLEEIDSTLKDTPRALNNIVDKSKLMSILRKEI